MIPHEFLISNEFKSYQKKLLKLFATTIWNQMKGEQFAQAKGAMDLAIKAIELPLKMFPNSEDVKNNTKEAIKEFQTEFIRIHFE